jgi:23S rRNA (adenine2503-C2)-methyltransferase
MQWLYKRGEADIAAMTDLAKDFRAQLAGRAEIAVPKIVKTQVASDGTPQVGAVGRERAGFEMVFIPEEDRGTLCISSQVGCVLDCTFCSTAQQGFNRNLTTAEIVGQVWLANRDSLEGRRRSHHHQHRASWAWASRWRFSQRGAGHPHLPRRPGVRHLAPPRDD